MLQDRARLEQPQARQAYNARMREYTHQQRREYALRGESWDMRWKTPEQATADLALLAERAKEEDPERQRTRLRANWARRDAWKRAPGEAFAPEEIFERDGWICGICGAGVDQALEHPHPMSVSIDHIIPYALGGQNLRDNVQCSHLHCNLRKAARGMPV